MNTTTQRFLDVLDRLTAEYADTPSMLSYNSPFELLISVILSAQTTDEQVNRVTPVLFRKYHGPKELARALQSDVEEIIHSTGYYRNKAKNIIGAARVICDRFGGTVPDTMEELTEIPGTGRKSAGVMLNHVFGKPAIIVDTHFGRVCNRMGFTTKTGAAAVEREIAGILDSIFWNTASMCLNYHGRKYCTARKPECTNCPVRDLCNQVGVNLTQ